MNPMFWVLPPPSNSDHKDYYMFSRGFVLTFTFHCYREGAISNLCCYYGRTVAVENLKKCIVFFHSSMHHRLTKRYIYIYIQIQSY